MRRITFNVTEDDFMAYARHHFRHSDDARASRNRLFLVAPVALGIYAFGTKDDPNYGLAHPAMFALRIALVAATFGGLLAFYFLVVRRTLMQRWLKTAVGRAVGRTTLELKDDGIHVTTSEGKGRLKWAECRGIVDEKDHVFVIIGPLRAFVIPKSTFSEEAPLADFLEFARSHQRSAIDGKIEKA